MEIVYFYKSSKEKDVKYILSTDEFMKISYDIRDVTQYSPDKTIKGFYIYIIGDQQEITSLDLKLSSLGLIERFSEKNQVEIIEKFKKDVENAANGLGLIFG